MPSVMCMESRKLRNLRGTEFWDHKMGTWEAFSHA